jgi:hypothetical protein
MGNTPKHLPSPCGSGLRGDLEEVTKKQKGGRDHEEKYGSAYFLVLVRNDSGDHATNYAFRR